MNRTLKIKKLGRRKKCPENIKKKLNLIKKYKDDEKKAKKELADFKKENKEVIDKFNKLRDKKYILARKKRQTEYNLLAITEINPIYIQL